MIRTFINMVIERVSKSCKPKFVEKLRKEIHNILLGVQNSKQCNREHYAKIEEFEDLIITVIIEVLEKLGLLEIEDDEIIYSENIQETYHTAIESNQFDEIIESKITSCEHVRSMYV